MAVAVVDIQVKSSGATQQLRAVQQGAQATSQAVDKLNAATAAASDKFKTAANGIKYFIDATGRARAENGRFLSSTERTAAGLQAQGRAAEQAASKMRGLNSAMEKFQGAMAAAGPYIAIAAGIAAAAGAALKFTNEIDRNRQQLTLFTKNVGATNAIIADLKVTADATSLGLPGLLEATKTLAAYGVSAKNAGTATKLLGDLALGDNEKLQRFAVNLGQISSIGRAYTVDLKQFAMAGIPIFEALAKVMGTSTGEVLRLAEQGKVTYPIVIKAINELTKEGASFFDGAALGGTKLDRSLAQLQGSFESLQVIIGNAVGPIAVVGVKNLKEELDKVLLAVKQLSNEYNYWSGLVSKSDFGNAIVNQFKIVQKFLQENPYLMSGADLLNPLGRFTKTPKKEDPNKTKTDVTKLLDEANAIARKNAETELANLKIENTNKIAKLNKNTELQLKDNRFQYEQQIADFRESTIRRIADMERTLQDQRIKANFDLQQSQLKLAGSNQFIKQTQDISRAIVSGKSPADIQSLETARDSAKALNDAAISRRQIEFDATMKRIQLERTLTDFKKGIEREIGEMQKGYARQVDGILQTAGRSLGELMVEGANKAKQIMESIKPTVGAGDKIGPSVSSGIIARTGNTGDSTGPHLDIRWADGRPITKADADKYFALNGKSPSSYGVTSGYGKRNMFGRSFHAGIDFGTPSGTPISVKGGAALTKNLGNTGTGGYAAEISTPQGPMRILHLLANSIAKIPAAAKTGPAAAALQAPAGSRAMQVDAVNSIKPFSSPTAKLDKETNELKRAAAEQKITDLRIAQSKNTESLAESTKTVLNQSEADLNTSKEKNKVDQKTLDLIISGTNPALAAQFAQNEQLNAQSTAALENQKKEVLASLDEKNITFQQHELRLEDFNLLSQQIAKQPQVLEGLNQQAIKQKQITDATQATVKAADDLKALYSDIGMSIKSGVIDAIQGAIDGTKSLQQVATDLLKKIGDKLLDVAVNMALFGSMSGTGTGGGLLGGFFKSTPTPKAKGGSVTGGTPYLVGERGPELFMPGRSGGIAPAGSFGGGTNVVVNVDATGSNVQGDDQSSKQLGVLLAAAVQKELIKQKRPGGILA